MARKPGKSRFYNGTKSPDTDMSSIRPIIRNLKLGSYGIYMDGKLAFSRNVNANEAIEFDVVMSGEEKDIVIMLS